MRIPCIYIEIHTVYTYTVYIHRHTVYIYLIYSYVYLPFKTLSVWYIRSISKTRMVSHQSLRPSISSWETSNPKRGMHLPKLNGSLLHITNFRPLPDFPSICGVDSMAKRCGRLWVQVGVPIEPALWYQFVSETIHDLGPIILMAKNEACPQHFIHMFFVIP